MTTLTVNPVEDRLRTVLLVDAFVVGLSGVLLAATPPSWYGSAPSWLSVVAGIALALAAADVASRPAGGAAGSGSRAW